jgi:hypothetical protein
VRSHRVVILTAAMLLGCQRLATPPCPRGALDVEQARRKVWAPRAAAELILLGARR